ncbi:DNA oxidative demethylase AlkB [Komagataeibacter rhaeticus]|uniref:DNA oxidative demethylase AlkB n=1 Tax=Komagataeibacter rhaeticus TaxID=215221 RepID=UPI000A049F6F|nr:DNA oxidative demethylase AlkB [Komagataeibacter rhaeticus]
MMQPDLFGAARDDIVLSTGALFLPGFAVAEVVTLLAHIRTIAVCSPFRHMITPGGRRMSVAMTSCGRFGWTSGREGYGYTSHDPDSGQAWPLMPPVFRELARKAATRAGFADFSPDTCLVNRYAPGTRLSLHQDLDEGDMSAPIVSVSLGLPAIFLWGGPMRSDTRRRIMLHEGDVMVWGREARMNFHGVEPLPPGNGTCRYNLTFRKAR